MPSIEQYEPRTTIRRGQARQIGRALASIDGQTSVAVAAADAIADRRAAQVDALTAVTQRGLQAAAYLTHVEMTLAEATPAAMTRLKLVGDTGAMALSQIVMETASQLRRIR